MSLFSYNAELNRDRRESVLNYLLSRASKGELYPHDREERFFREITVLILGEHDKGFRVPFSRFTVSGRRLRDMLNEIGGPYTLDNVFLFDGKTTKPKNLPLVCKSYQTVIALGRIAEAECQRQGVKATYLPHPAARSARQLRVLRAGLQKILNR